MKVGPLRQLQVRPRPTGEAQGAAAAIAVGVPRPHGQPPHTGRRARLGDRASTSSSRPGIGTIYKDIVYDQVMLKTQSKVCKLNDKPYTLAEHQGERRSLRDAGRLRGPRRASRSASRRNTSAARRNSGGLHAWVMWVEVKAVQQGRGRLHPGIARPLLRRQLLRRHAARPEDRQEDHRPRDGTATHRGRQCAAQQPPG